MSVLRACVYIYIYIYTYTYIPIHIYMYTPVCTYQKNVHINYSLKNLEEYYVSDEEQRELKACGLILL